LDIFPLASSDQHLFFVGGSFCHDAAKRIGDKRLTPKRELAFLTYSINGRHVNAVGNSVRALDRLPCGMLRLVHVLLFVWQPADCRRIEQKLRTGKRGQTRRFGKPLVPTNQRANLAMLRPMSLKTKIAGCEIELLVIERIVRDMHLAILAGDLSVGVDGDGGVVVNAGGALLK